jgi:hypothetical protein
LKLTGQVMKLPLLSEHWHALSIGKNPNPMRATERNPKKIDSEGHWQWPKEDVAAMPA